MERVAAAPVKQTGRNAATGALFDYYLTKEELEDRLATDMRAAAAAIKTTRVLTVHGSDDQVIPVDDGRAFARDIAGSSLHIVSGADHNFRAPQHADDMIRAIVNFVTAASSPAN